MAKNELVALALIYFKPMHVYGINSMLKDMRLEMWAKISPASIYNTLARLSKGDYAEEKSEQVGNMPPRKVYSITEKGKELFAQELEKAIINVFSEGRLFYLVILFAFGLPREKCIQLTEQRIDLLEKAKERLNQDIEFCRALHILSGLINAEAGMKHVEIEIETAQSFIKLLHEHPDYYTHIMKNLMESDYDNK